MWKVLVLTFLTLGLCVAQNGPIQKLSNNIIRNMSTYVNVYPSPRSSMIYMDTSTNLIDWTFGNVLSDGETDWSNSGPIPNLDVNVIGPKKVRLYFTALSWQTGYTEIGVASAIGLNTTEVYTMKNTSLFGLQKRDITQPCLIPMNNGSLLLTFSVPDASMGAVVLNDDGTSVTSHVNYVIKADQEWEAGKIRNQWGFQRGEYVYIFYETGKGAVGVARSVDPLGKFEKKLFSKSKISRRGFFQDLLQWGDDHWPML